MLVGSLRYLSPEVVFGHDAQPASDVYALGLIFFELLTGNLPYRGRTPQEWFQKITEVVPAPPSRFQNVPDAANAPVLRLLEKNPENRGTLSDLMADLDELARRFLKGRKPVFGLWALESIPWVMGSLPGDPEQEDPCAPAEPVTDPEPRPNTESSSEKTPPPAPSRSPHRLAVVLPAVVLAGVLGLALHSLLFRTDRIREPPLPGESEIVLLQESPGPPSAKDHLDPLDSDHAVLKDIKAIRQELDSSVKKAVQASRARERASDGFQDLLTGPHRPAADTATLFRLLGRFLKLVDIADEMRLQGQAWLEVEAVGADLISQSSKAGGFRQGSALALPLGHLDDALVHKGISLYRRVMELSLSCLLSRQRNDDQAHRLREATAQWEADQLMDNAETGWRDSMDGEYARLRFYDRAVELWMETLESGSPGTGKANVTKFARLARLQIMNMAPSIIASRDTARNIFRDGDRLSSHTSSGCLAPLFHRLRSRPNRWSSSRDMARSPSGMRGWVQRTRGPSRIVTSCMVSLSVTSRPMLSRGAE